MELSIQNNIMQTLTQYHILLNDRESRNNNQLLEELIF